MIPDEAARALLKNIGLPAGAANVLVWHDGDPPSLRIWVEERYLWKVKQSVPQSYEGYRVDIEPRPIITAYS